MPGILKFADDFERRFVHQQERRELDETLDLAWELLSVFPEEELKRIPPAIFAARSEALANRVLPAGDQSEM